LGIKSGFSSNGSEAFFERMYKHSFNLLLAAPGQRTADKAQCIELWTALFSAPSLQWETKNVNWLEEWNSFVESSSVKGINRDQWNHVLKLAKMSLQDETLSWHDEEQSWPSIIDDFVADFKSKHQKADEMEL
jgi:hypothetical protein